MLRDEVLADAEAAAQAGAALIATAARDAVERRGRFLVAFSGGSTPRRMLELLALHEVPWSGVHVFQVDERVAAPDEDRNLALLTSRLVANLPTPLAALHAMPVEVLDLEEGARAYARALRVVGGDPVRLDLVHLGLGDDGHTASLVPGDPVVEAHARSVAMTATYHGYRRMTLTFPVLNQARQILWLVCGSSKAGALEQLRQGDSAIPAGRVRREDAVILSDLAANGSGRER